MLNYPYIRAWGHQLGSVAAFIEAEVEEARKDNAPTDAVYKRRFGADKYGTWVTVDEIKAEDTRERLHAAVRRMQEVSSSTTVVNPQPSVRDNSEDLIKRGMVRDHIISIFRTAKELGFEVTEDLIVKAIDNQPSVHHLAATKAIDCKTGVE